MHENAGRGIQYSFIRSVVLMTSCHGDAGGSCYVRQTGYKWGIICHTVVCSGFIWIRVCVIAPLVCSGPLKAGFQGDRKEEGVVSGPSSGLRPAACRPLNRAHLQKGREPLLLPTDPFILQPHKNTPNKFYTPSTGLLCNAACCHNSTHTHTQSEKERE